MHKAEFPTMAARILLKAVLVWRSNPSVLFQNFLIRKL